MQLPIISIGNSKGLRLSKSLLEQYNIVDRVELILEKGFIIIKPLAPRQGWAEAFQQMREEGDDELLIPDVFEDETFD